MKAPFAPPFLASEPRATGLLDDGFRRPAAWREEARARALHQLSPEVLRALAAQQELLPPSEARRCNLAALAERGTVAVVTGQQIGLFLGPLYTFYKAATAIVWARAIEAQAGARCVPIFWLQTEDHDFAEIAGCEVPPALRLSLPDAGARCSVAHLTLPQEVAGLVDRLAQSLSQLPHADETVALVRAAYLPGRGLAHAFAVLLAAVFADEGLLVLDPRCAEVARASSGIYAQAIRRAGEIDAALLRRGEELERAGLREQVNVRRGSPLIFFHGPDAQGPRRRLQRRGADFELDGGGRVPAEELLQAAQGEPLRLSSSALLRPLVQDSILPAVAYVGGPAELGYLAQTAPLYAMFGVRPSLAVPRARFRILDARTSTLLRTLGLEAKDVEVRRDQLLERLGAQRAGPPEDLARRFLGDLPAKLASSAQKHPALARAARRTQLSVERALSRFASRHARLAAAEDQTLVDRVDRLQAALFPGGAPQERVHSLPYYAARHGLSALKASVLGAIRPGETAVQDVAP